MKKKILLITSMVVVLFGCSKQNDPNPEDALSFETKIESPQKGTPISGTVYPDNTNFGVFAYYTGQNDMSVTQKPNFMYNQKVVHTTGSSYTYAPLKYWPNNVGDKISFYAYSPYDADEAGENIIPAEAPGYPIYIFTADPIIANQTDLMVASVENQTKPTVGNIVFSFRHVLTQLRFVAKMNQALAAETTVTLTSLKIKEVQTSAMINLKTQAWSQFGNPHDFTLALNPANCVFNNASSTNEQEITGSDQIMLMIPQALDQTNSIEITYKVKTIDASLPAGFTEITNNVTIPLNGVVWEKNKKVKFVLGINLTNISFDTSISDWEI